ncbi:thermonuclease family protein [Paraliobacillus sp. PM-2]|nr:thermonuclease family protein [Paraliobacillus sp. PM-2]
MLNELLLEEGFAYVAYAYHPPYKHYQRCIHAQIRAKISRKGIWAEEVF